MLWQIVFSGLVPPSIPPSMVIRHLLHSQLDLSKFWCLVGLNSIGGRQQSAWPWCACWGCSWAIRGWSCATWGCWRQGSALAPQSCKAFPAASMLIILPALLWRIPTSEVLTKCQQRPSACQQVSVCVARDRHLNCSLSHVCLVGCYDLTQPPLMSLGVGALPASVAGASLPCTSVCAFACEFGPLISPQAALVCWLCFACHDAAAASVLQCCQIRHPLGTVKSLHLTSVPILPFSTVVGQLMLHSECVTHASSICHCRALTPLK